ncbi:rhomboid-related protein 4 isoform X12 [Bubalus kerabau]|nr:rhomboid-related protein 4 isoform X12 [Bubalus carabanensis]
MVSMLWKGIHLERRLGSRWFAYIIVTFSLLTGVVYLFLEFALAEFLNEPDFKRNCAVGFSGVLFALKVLNNHCCPGGFVNVLGFPVSNRFACWVELLAIHFISPGTSFAGHLAGILVGLMYTHGPLKKIMESCTGIFPSNIDYPGQQYYFNSSGYSGYQDYYPYGGQGAYEDVPRNYDTYTAGLSEEEQLERALRASLLDQGNRTEGNSQDLCVPSTLQSQLNRPETSGGFTETSVPEGNKHHENNTKTRDRTSCRDEPPLRILDYLQYAISL